MSHLNEDKVTVTITLKGEYAQKLIKAQTKAKRSRRNEVIIRLEDHLRKNPNFYPS